MKGGHILLVKRANLVDLNIICTCSEAALKLLPGASVYPFRTECGRHYTSALMSLPSLPPGLLLAAPHPQILRCSQNTLPAICLCI